MGLFSIFRRADADRTDTRPVEGTMAGEQAASSVADVPEETVSAPTITPPAWAMLPPLTATSHRPIARTFDTDIGRRLRAQRSAGELLASSSLSHTVDPASHGVVEGLVRVSAADGMPAVRAGSDGVLRRRVLRAADLPAADAAHPRWPMLARSAATDWGGAAPLTSMRPTEPVLADDREELDEGMSSLQRAVDADATGTAAGGSAGFDGVTLQRSSDDSAPMRQLASVDAPLTGRTHVARLSAAPITPAFDAPAVGAATQTRPASLPLAAPAGANVARAAEAPIAAPAPMTAPLRRRSIVEVPSTTSGTGDAAPGLVARSTDELGGAAIDESADDASSSPAAASTPVARSAERSGAPGRDVPTIGRRPGLGAPLDALPPTAVLRSVDDDPFAGWNDADPLPLAGPREGAATDGSGDAGAMPVAGAVGAPTLALRSSASDTASATGPSDASDSSVPMLRVVDGAGLAAAAGDGDAPGLVHGGEHGQLQEEEVRPLASSRALGVDGTGLLDRAVEVGPAVVRIDRSVADGGGSVEGTGRVARSSADAGSGTGSGSGGPGGRSATAAMSTARGATTATTTTTMTGGTAAGLGRVTQRTTAEGPATPGRATSFLASGAPVPAARLSAASASSAPSMVRSSGASAVARSVMATSSTSFGETAAPGVGGALLARSVGDAPSSGGDLPPGGSHGALPLALAPLRRLPADAAPAGGGLRLERLPNIEGSSTTVPGTTVLLERESDDSGGDPSSNGGAGTPGPGAQAPSAADGQGGTGGAGPAAPGATASTAQADTDLDALAGRLYDRIRYRLRRELLDDRERAGLVLDRVR